MTTQFQFLSATSMECSLTQFQFLSATSMECSLGAATCGAETMESLGIKDQDLGAGAEGS